MSLFCPLRMIDHNPDSSKVCLQEHCAWWVVGLGGGECAVTHICESIGQIKKSLDSIDQEGIFTYSKE